MSELKNGDRCLVSNVSEEDARDNAEIICRYVGVLGNGNHVVEMDDGGDPDVVSFAVSAPEQNTPLKNGDRVYFSNVSKAKVIDCVGVGHYVGTARNGLFVVEERSGVIDFWDYVVKVEEPELAQYTFETIPKGSVLVRREGVDSEMLVLSWDCEGIKTDNGHIVYSVLRDKFEISVDNGKNWQRAGVVVNPE